MTPKNSDRSRPEQDRIYCIYKKVAFALHPDLNDHCPVRKAWAERSFGLLLDRFLFIRDWMSGSTNFFSDSRKHEEKKRNSHSVPILPRRLQGKTDLDALGLFKDSDEVESVNLQLSGYFESLKTALMCGPPPVDKEAISTCDYNIKAIDQHYLQCVINK